MTDWRSSSRQGKFNRGNSCSLTMNVKYGTIHVPVKHWVTRRNRKMALLEKIQSEAQTTLDEIKDIPPLTKGHYYAQIIGNAEEIVSAKKQTPGLQFTMRLISARDDVEK